MAVKRHIVSYTAVSERSDAYTVQYEETYCGKTRRFVVDEPLTPQERRQKDAEAKAYAALPLCKTCVKEMNFRKVK